MTRYILLIFILIQTTSLAYKIDSRKIDYLRLTYYQAVEHEEYIDTLENFIAENFKKEEINTNPILIAYLGGIESLKSKHAFWPFSKMSYLNDSMEILQKAVSLDSNNVEIRFMRFSILHYVPGILGFSEERENDLEKLLLLLSDNEADFLPNQVLQGIVNFMVDSDRLTEEQSYLVTSRNSLTKK